MDDKGKKLEEGVPPEGQDLEDMVDGLAADEVPEEEIKPWLVTPPTKEMIDIYLNGPDRDEFLKWCDSVGMVPQQAQKVSKTTGISAGAKGLDLSDVTAVISEITARVMAEQKLATTTPTQGEAPPDYEWVDFPDPRDVKLPDGTVGEIPLTPINLGNRDYTDSGLYRPEIAQRLTVEIEGARVVDVPQNAAFVNYKFRRENEDGKVESVTEMYVGPVFAYKSMADSLEKQINSLVEFDIPAGPIPGTQTKYDDMITNGVRMVTGYRYLVPPRMKPDLERRVKEHEIAFQNLHKERIVLGEQGRSAYSGQELSALEANARKQQGFKPEDIVNQIQPGNLR